MCGLQWLLAYGRTELKVVAEKLSRTPLPFERQIDTIAG